MPGHARRHSAMSCANVAEPMEMLFGLWNRMGMCYMGLNIGAT